MGYTTNFSGQFDITPKLRNKDLNFLVAFNRSRRMQRNLDPKYGVDGEFYVKDDDRGIVDSFRPPSTQPGLWCQWMPTGDGRALIWDGGEKFYDYVPWLQYLIDRVLKPRGYTLNGVVDWEGENRADSGRIEVVNNEIFIRRGTRSYGRPKRY